MIWFKHYPGDYLTATLRLSMTEDGCYRRLMDEYYSTETPLPLDREELMSVARARKPNEESAVDKIVKLFFKRESDGYHHKRIDAEITKARGIAATNRRIAHEREERKKNDTSNESLNDTSNESKHPNTTIPEVRSQKSKAKKSEPNKKALSLPDFINKKTFQDFVDNRKKLKAPMTDKAITLLINKLKKLKSEGHDVNQLLENSIMNGWKSVFPEGSSGIKKEPVKRRGFKDSKYEPTI